MRVHVAPRGTRDFLRDAVITGGGVVTDDVRDAVALVYTAPNDPAGLRALLRENPALRWVQLPWAGIEHYVAVLDDARIWTAGQGVYADDVSEHVLALVLASLRDLKARSTATSWQPPSGRSLRGARVTVFGAGGIARSLIALLAPFDVTLTFVRRPRSGSVVVDDVVPGARVVGLTSPAAAHDAVRDADVVVLALALTALTRGLVDDAFLAAMKPGALLVNVARGAHVDTAALLVALDRGHIRAALDVTDPEPLPAGHPLFAHPACLITPHCANTPQMALPVLTTRVRENVRRFIAGEPLLGLVDVNAGY